jgi:hypothetical protein
MDTTSRIPATIDALLAVVGPAAGEDVNVVDGPPLSWDATELAQDAVSETSYLFVGAIPDSDVAADGTQDFNAAGAVSRDERFTINCTAFVWSGDQTIKTVRDAAFGLVAVVEQAIRDDPSLGGAVLYSRMSGVIGAAQTQDEQGCNCTVMFTVDARAYLE